VPPRDRATRYVADVDLRVWPRGGLVLGGTPWGVVRLGPAAMELLRRVVADGAAGSCPSGPAQERAARRLVARGLLHPVPPTTDGEGSVAVVVPTYGRPEHLDRCLASLAGLDVTVVDDASPGDAVAAVAAAHGAALVRHPVNRGPAAARNTGFAATRAPLVAFVDDDCEAPQGWVDALAPLFEDERVVAVAPRVAPRAGDGGSSVLRRYETARSALDMGAHPALVMPGGRLGFLPSAAIVVRRSAAAGGFDEGMRLGEDVDLVWRLAGAGGQVRYHPAVTVAHATRADLRGWLRRRFEYGTSAAALEARHPGRLAPFRPSPWSLAVLVAAGAGRWPAALSAGALATALLARRLRAGGADPAVALVVVGQGVLADWLALGHALRREWWPVGAVCLAAAGGVPAARLPAAGMLVPLAMEWWRRPPDLDPLRYAAIRLVDDAAYGTGVLVAGLRARRWSVLAPRVRRVRRVRRGVSPA
jgi:mycofactocin system glycosyltransferase